MKKRILIACLLLAVCLQSCYVSEEHGHGYRHHHHWHHHDHDDHDRY